MSNRERLINQLAELDDSVFDDVLTSALTRRDKARCPISTEPPENPSRDEYAVWLAQRHLAADLGLEKVVYLPAGAPDTEIRLLEINRRIDTPSPDLIEPLDFTPDDHRVPYTVFAADISIDQWNRIKSNQGTALPPGWELMGFMTITRGSHASECSGEALPRTSAL